MRCGEAPLGKSHREWMNPLGTSAESHLFLKYLEAVPRSYLYTSSQTVHLERRAAAAPASHDFELAT
jgi:hypothetical protein